MKNTVKIKALNTFQSNSFKTYRKLGFNADNANLVFGIIIGMRNLVVSAEKQDSVLLHKYMGVCAEQISNYATVNNINLGSCIGIYTHEQMQDETELLDLEFYLEKIKDDLSFVKDMKESERTEFIQKCWISVFPDEYHNDFIKVERILHGTIVDNKNKYPEKFASVIRQSVENKYGME